MEDRLIDEEAPLQGGSHSSVPEPESIEAEMSLSIGVDAEQNRVALDIEITGLKDPIKVRFLYSEEEIGKLCLSMVSAANSLKKSKSPIVLPPSGNTRLPLNGRAGFGPPGGGPKPR